MRRIGREGWLLMALLAVLLAASLYYGGASSQSQSRPTTYSTDRGGLKAYYDFLLAGGLRVRRWDRRLTDLPRSAGLLVVAEPLDLGMEQEEWEAAQKWAREGGTLLALVAERELLSPRGLDLPGLAVLKGAAKSREIRPRTTLPLTRGVGRVRVGGRVHLGGGTPAWRSVVREGGQGYVMVSRVGRGRIVVATTGAGLLNGDIGKADNVILYDNLARLATATRPGVLFDEYHHGFGYADAGERSLWHVVGWSGRAVVWYALALFAVALYSLNRRFGRPMSVLGPGPRGTADYVTSMAGLYRRAAAREVAVAEVHRACVRRLSMRLGLAADADPDVIARHGARQLGIPEGALREDLRRGAALAAGGKASDADVVGLARRLGDYARKAVPDGHSG